MAAGAWKTMISPGTEKTQRKWLRWKFWGEIKQIQNVKDFLWKRLQSSSVLRVAFSLCVPFINGEQALTFQNFLSFFTLSTDSSFLIKPQAGLDLSQGPWPGARNPCLCNRVGEGRSQEMIRRSCLQAMVITGCGGSSSYLRN